MTSFNRADLSLLAIGLGLVALTALGPLLHQRLGGIALLAVVLACGAAASRAGHIAVDGNARMALWIILAGAAGMRLALLFTEPALSTDVWRYIWDGRVQAAGVNPYRYIPRAPELEALRDAVVFPKINRADYAVTIYPPVAQMIFFAITRLGESLLAMKLGLLAFEALAMVSIIAILRQLGVSDARVAAYAWHPLPVWEIAGNAHVDAAMVGLMLLGLALFVRGGKLISAIVIAAAALVKPTALLTLPALWRPWNWKLPLVVALTIGMLYAPYLAVGWGVLGFLPDYVREEGLDSGSRFWLLAMVERLTGRLAGGGRIYLLLAGVMLSALALRAGLRADRGPRSTLVAVAGLIACFLILLSPAYPWYFVALVPFCALTNTLTPWVLTLGAFLLYDVIPGDRLPVFMTRSTILYILTLTAVACDLRSARARLPSTTAVTTGGTNP